MFLKISFIGTLKIKLNIVVFIYILVAILAADRRVGTPPSILPEEEVH